MKNIVCIVLAMLLTVGCMDSDKKKEIETSVDSQVLTHWFLEKEYLEIWERLSSTASSRFSSFEAFKSYADSFNNQLGKRTSSLDKHIFTSGDLRYAETIATFDNLPDGTRAAFFWGLNDDNSRNVEMVTTRLVPAEAASKFSYEYESKTDFILPFNESMVVLWGGKSTFLNYHADTVAQRYAIDFVTFENGRHFAGLGVNNEDHYCWGQKIVAPALGKIVSVASSIRDNDIGKVNTNTDEYLGNHVVIDHGNGEYSILAHLRQNTVTVQVDEFVSEGDFIGECGNSGLSDIPHLHFHVQDSQSYLDITGAQGIPPTFYGIYSDGEFHKTKKIIRGEWVSNDEE